MERANQEEHRQQPQHGPPDHSVERAKLGKGVRQHVKQSDAEHQPGDEADRDLHAGVRQLHDKGEPAAPQRAEDNQPAVNDEQGEDFEKSVLKAI